MFELESSSAGCGDFSVGLLVSVFIRFVLGGSFLGEASSSDKLKSSSFRKNSGSISDCTVVGASRTDLMPAKAGALAIILTGVAIYYLKNHCIKIRIRIFSFFFS